MARAPSVLAGVTATPIRYGDRETSTCGHNTTSAAKSCFEAGNVSMLGGCDERCK